MDFNAWSREWKAARKTPDIVRVLELWATPLPENWKRLAIEWEGALGFRKNHTLNGNDRGEQKLERLLLDCGKTRQLNCCSKDSSCRLTSVYHNLPLANRRGNQIIADAFAAITIRRQTHPLLVEIKTNANNCWYALVENLLQVRLARACENELCTRFEEAVGTKFKGAWGMVLAPNEYYTTKGTSKGLDESMDLLAELKEKTEARVAFCGADDIKNGAITIIKSNWEL